MNRDKCHKVSEKDFKVRPALTINMGTLCGLDGNLVAYKWMFVTCKRCLKKKLQEERMREK